jgi:hypothetical protein
MKKLATFTTVSVLLLLLGSCGEVSGKDARAETGMEEAKTVEVYYFHYTRRCASCVAVERESKKAVEELYADKVKTGEVRFYEINLDEEEGKKIAASLNRNGQGLIVVFDNAVVDLTQQGFMYAMRDPGKLKDAIKQAVDNFMR